MTRSTKSSSLKKRFLARYIYWMETVGFVFIGVLLTVMIVSAVYKIDDVMKFNNVQAAPRREAIVLPEESYVDAVTVSEGAEVKNGQELLQVSTGKEDLALLKTIDSIRKSLDHLQERPTGTKAPNGVEEALNEALTKSKAASRKDSPHPIPAPIDGFVETDVKGSWNSLTGKIVNGRIGSIYTYDSLRLAVPVGGENASRVRINLLAEQDILDWKNLTQNLKSERPPSDPATQRIWNLLKGKLEEIKPGKTPLKRNMPEIIAALNELLRRKDFHDPKAWTDKPIPPEAQQLLLKGPDQLNSDELIKLNRILLRIALPQAVAPGADVRQTVKAKLYIPVRRQTPDGAFVKEKPKIFLVEGQVVHEPDGGKAIVDLPHPPDEIVDYMKRQTETPGMPPITASGRIVVGRITLFRFLFK